MPGAIINGEIPDFLQADTVVVRNLLERHATEAPDAPLATFDEDGSSWTRLQGLQQAYASANELHRAGVRQGDVVAAAVPNSAAYFRAWWGAAALGAAVVPVNPGNKGVLVTRMLDIAKPKVIVTGDAFRQRLTEVGVPASTTLFDPTEIIGTDRTPPVLEHPIMPWDVASLAMTSGTTGPSKVVRVSYAHSGNGAWMVLGRWGIDNDDVYLCDVPMVHVSGLYTVHAALANGTQIAVRARPDLAHYWEVARDSRATLSQLYSTMVSYVDAQPPRGAEQDHRLRVMITLPFPSDPPAFQKRFNIPQLTIGWGSTEIGCGVGLTPEAKILPGSTGRIFPGWEVRLVDENDIDVPQGTPGEAIVRSDRPWLVTTEYIDDPAATAKAWRNGWFHTGDLLRVDEDGDYFFVDRVKDALRRRGQNISSFEVENVVVAFPGINEAAVVPERSDTDVEDEVKAWIVLADGLQTIDFEAMLHHCSDHLPHYMVPRYFEIAKELPKTPSAKVRKHLLREQGGGVATWDRLKNGFDVTRRGVVSLPVDSSASGSRSGEQAHVGRLG